MTATTSISGRGVDIKLGGKTVDQNTKEIKKLGGLLVIGTERMESRRADLQAKEKDLADKEMRSFYIFCHLEDDLMRIFGSESMNNVLKSSD